MSNEFLEQKMDYIHNKPVKLDVVVNAEDYKFSSAIEYTGGKGLIDVIFAD